MTLTLKTDYVTEALRRLPQQFQETETWPVLVTAIVKQLQELENALWGMRNLTSIADSSGAQLDLIGKLYGVGRAGRSDADYRILLAGQSLLLNTSGESERIRLVLQAMIPGSSPEVVDSGEAAFTASMIGVQITSPVETMAIIRAAKAAGVTGYVYWQTAPDDETFCFDGGPGLGYDDGEYAGILKA